MFERFTPPARDVVTGALTQALRLGDPALDAEHLLLGIVVDPAAPVARILADLGLDHGALTRRLIDSRAGDADALNAIGVDLAAVRREAETAFGPGALDDPPAPPRTGLLRRGRRSGGGHLPVTDAAKVALARSLREAVDLQHGHIGPEHILLGLVADDRAPAAITLSALGVSPAEVRRRVRDEFREAA